jgi:tetratricopeptide (TPR) repeat protein
MFILLAGVRRLHLAMWLPGVAPSVLFFRPEFMTNPAGQIRALLVELKRRSVFRVAAVYAAVAFVMLQAADLVFPALGLPGWTVTLVVALALFGFPLALVLAWAFEMTPDGVRRQQAPLEPASVPAASPPRRANRAAWFALGVMVAGSVAWYGVARVGGGDESLDANTVAVVPFRVAGAEAAVAYLREGMVDLLAAKLTGEWGPRAVDPRTLMSAWRRAVPREDEDLPPAAAAALGRQLGAGSVVLGEIVSTPGRLIITASTVDTRTGRTSAPVTVDGPPDSLPALVDRLAATLLTRGAGEADHRLAALTSTSLPALREYLRARSHHRMGRFEEALDGFLRALDHDSTFALAAIGADRAAGWTVARTAERAGALDIAWRHRERLSSRDRAVLDAIAGPRYPGPTSPRERLEAWERVAQQSPDDPEAWYEVGDILFHYGRLLGDEDMERSVRAFRRAHTLDPTSAVARIHLHDAALLRGDSATAIRMANEHIALEPAGFYAFFMQLSRGYLQGEAAPMDSLVDVLDRSADVEMAMALMLTLPVDGFPGPLVERLLLLADHAAGSGASWTATADQRLQVAEQLRRYAYNRGRVSTALRASRQVSTLSGNPLREHHAAVLAGLYWDGDAEAAASGARRLERAVQDAGGAAALGRTAAGRTALCALAQWRLANGGADGVPSIVDVLRAAPRAEATVTLDVGGTAASIDALCASLLEAWAADVAGRPDAEDLLHRLDRHLDEGLEAGGTWQLANIVVARLMEQRGDLHGAYRAIRRQIFLPGTELFATTVLREQGRLAARLGDRDAAIRAYRTYLLFHSDPEPGPAADAAAAVRRELAGLVEGT